MTVSTISFGDRILRFLFPDTNKRIIDMSVATDRLTASVADLSTKVDALIAQGSTSTGSDDTAVNAAADAVDALSAKVDAALIPAPEAEA